MLPSARSIAAVWYAPSAIAPPWRCAVAQRRTNASRRRHVSRWNCPRSAPPRGWLHSSASATRGTTPEAAQNLQGRKRTSARCHHAGARDAPLAQLPAKPLARLEVQTTAASSCASRPAKTTSSSCRARQRKGETSGTATRAFPRVPGNHRASRGKPVVSHLRGQRRKRARQLRGRGREPAVASGQLRTAARAAQRLQPAWRTRRDC